MSPSTARIRSPREGTHLLDYLRVLLKRLWLIVGFFILVVGIVAFASKRATRLYRAQAVININQPKIVMGSPDLASMVQAYEQTGLYYQTQYALLSQRSTVKEMVDLEFAKFSEWEEFQNLDPDAIVDRIVGAIEVSPRKQTTLVDVAIVCPDQRIVHEICNLLVKTFADLQARRRKTTLEDTLDSLEKKSLEYQQKVDQTEKEISILLERHGTDRETFLDEFGRKRTRLDEIEKRLDDSRVTLAQRRALYEEIAAGLDASQEGGLDALFKLDIVREDPRIVELENSISTKNRSLRELEAESLLEKNPRIVGLRKEIEELDVLLRHERAQILRRSRYDFEALEREAALYEDMAAKLREEFRALSTAKRQYDSLLDVAKRYSSEAERYSVAWDKLQTGKSGEIRPVTIVEEAVAAARPFKPDVRTNMLLAVVFGLLGGVALAFFLEYMDDTVKSKEELERITDIPLFGVIPNIATRHADTMKRDLYAHHEPKSTVSEAFRGIRTALSYSSQRQENRVYLLTSAGPREGKTTTAINIATVMAYSGTKTVLVDADLRRPRIHQSFGVDNSRGLTNVIVGDMKVEEVVRPCGLAGLEGLDLLTSGPIPPNPSELLGRERMVEILRELQRLYDRVLIDSPPLGAVTDAAVLGRIVDSVILVVHAGRTRRKLIERGLEQLAQINVDVSGIVLNNLRIGRRRYYPGYYHYYYYYSTYYGPSDGKKGRSKDAKSPQGPG
ncbi:MAG: polysaccharide biosynthesis tyrosine autokinase [Planctomycetes bacterium]|jgi:tyrosine-protein kinase Etk/Wzc|nr:polysaccharide biosynthesis tyrosine autokinase [Planctomycetota bacterium]